MKLVPGGDAIEKMFLPSHLKGTAREAVKSTSFMTRPLTRGMEGSLGSQALEVLVQRARSAGTESFAEGAEEASGAVAKGLELSRAGQDVKLDEMAGEAAGQGMAVGGIMGGTAGARGAGAAPRVLEQPTRPTVPPVLSTARGQRGTQPHTAGGPASPPPPSPPSPSANPSAAPDGHSFGYSGGMLPGSGATWSEVAAADRKAQAEAEILRLADALPAQDVLAITPATAPAAAPATDSSTAMQQGTTGLPPGLADADAGQAAPSTAASTSADADPSAVQAEEQGAARHTAAAQAPVQVQIQALDSGMLVVRGDQAAIQSRLKAGGVDGARSFSGVTVVQVDQAALARRVLSAPPVEPIHRQVGGVPARALAVANAAQQKAASPQGAQQAPAVHRGEPAASSTFAGARTAGTNAAGPAVSPTSQGPQAGPQASAADVRALPPAPVQMEPLRDGTLMVRGDPKEIRARLLAAGVDRVIERKGGIVVGLDQVDKARKVLLAAAQPQSSPSPSRQGQQFSRSAPPAPDQASQARGLPLQPATVQSVRAAVARLTNSMGLLAGGRGRVVATTSDEIKTHWEPLIGEVDMGSQDTGLAQGFYDPETKTVFLIADHIEAGQEMAVAAHELMHKHGKAVLGERGWRQLHEVIGTWVGKPEGSLERRVHDEAVARVNASRPAGADAASYSSEELFPYAVQVAMELGVEPTAMRPITTVQGWLARVRAAMRGAWDRLTNRPELFDSQDLVDLAFAVAQRENPAYAREFDEPSASVSPGPGITAQQMQRIVDKALDGLGIRGMVTPQIAQSPGVVGLVAPPGTVATGGVNRGELYLFLEGIRDEVEGFRVVFHELFHLGLSQSIQPEEYRQAMLQFLSDPLVRKYAARWRMTEDGQSSKAKMPVNNWHAKAVEEAMADISEELHADQRGIGTREMAGWVRRTISWIADLAQKWGMPKVARQLRGMTLTQAEAFVVGTVLKARTGAPVLLPDARWASSRNGRDTAAAEAAYELMHQRGQAAMGETGWQQLLGPIDIWAEATEGSTERQIYDEAVRLMQASLHGEEATAYGSAQALFPYAVQAALQMRIQPTAKEPINAAAGWLARVRGGLRSTWNRLATDKGDFNSMNLVDLAFALAQQENAEHRPELDAVAQELADETAQLLSSISGAEDLFSLPRSRKNTVADIAAEHSPAIEVRKTDLAGETKYTLFLPDGTVATITSRDPTPHEVFGMDDASGQWITERPGEKAPPVGARSDVWVDVSRLEQGKWGGVIYNIAATFAHNTGRIFIGDPSGLKDIALRRRSEQMLASALKFGTTDHLAPHPRQVAGDVRLGVPPLHWVYGDSVGNIQRLIDVNLAALDNAFPDARNLTYDLDTGHFIDARTGDRLSKEALARSFNAGRAAGAIPANGAGWRTVARGAVLRALLGRWDQGSEGTSEGAGGERRGGRSEGVDGVGRQSDQPASPRNGEFERGRGTLAGLAEQRDRLGSDRPLQRIFYSRNRRSSEVAQ